MTSLPNLNSIDNIKNFFASHNGLQLSNRFIMTITGLPQAISQNGTVEIQAEQVEWGPRALYFIQDSLSGYGNGRLVPRSQHILASGSNGIVATFAVTNDNYILDFFNRWFNYFYSSYQNNNERPFILPYYDFAVAPVTIRLSLLDPNGYKNSETTFFEVFPVETQPLFMSMMKADNYMRYVVTFGFRDFVMNFNPNQQ